MVTEHGQVLENVLLCVFWHEQSPSTVQPFKKRVMSCMSPKCVAFRYIDITCLLLNISIGWDSS